MTRRIVSRSRQYATTPDLARQLEERDRDASDDIKRVNARIAAGSIGTFAISGGGVHGTRLTLTRDDDATRDLRLDGSVLSVTRPGMYLASVVMFATSSDAGNPGQVGFALTKNGTTIMEQRGQRYSAVVGNFAESSGTRAVHLSPSDELEVRASIIAGTATVLTSNGRSLLTLSLHTPD